MFSDPLWHPKTEVRSRCDCTARHFLGSQIASVGLPCVHKIIQIFERNSEPVFSPRKASSSLWSHVTSTSFIVDHVQQLRNHSFYNRRPYTFWCSSTLLGTPKRRSGRGYTARSDLLAVQNPFCGRPLCSTRGSRAGISCTLRSKLQHVVRKPPLMRLHCRCYVHKCGIIRLTIGKHTVLCGPWSHRRSGRGPVVWRYLTGVKNHLCATPLVFKN